MQTWQKRVSDRSWGCPWKDWDEQVGGDITALWGPVHLRSLLDDPCRVLSGCFNILLCSLVEKLEVYQHADGI